MKREVEIEVLEKRAYEVRKTFGFDNTSPIDFRVIKEKLNHATFVKYPLSRNFCGLIYKLDTQSAVIVINSTLNLGRQNFTFAHELYHYYYSSSDTKVCSFNEDFKKNKKDPEEVTADRFASYFLMPRFAFLDYFTDECGGIVSEESIIKLENHFMVNRYTVVSRLLKELLISKTNAKPFLKINFDKVNELGFSRILYESDPSSIQPSISGHYNELCEKLFNEQKIGKSKYDEIMNVLEK